MLYDVVILGSGPGGYVAALRAAQLGLRTAIVEREYVGGVCLNVGCIPSKALLRGADLLTTLKHADDFGIVVDNLHTDYAQAVARSRQVVGRLTKGVEFLLRRAKVDLVRGAGRLAARDRVVVATDDGERELAARNVVIATGARPLVFPGMEIDGEVVMTYKEAIVAESLPESVVMIGGGIIGCELGYLSRAYGAEVTILEMQPHLLPEMEPSLAEGLQRAFRRQGIKVETGSRVESVRAVEGRVTTPDAHDGGRGGARPARQAQVIFTQNDERRELTADRAIVALSVRPNTENIGLEAVGVQLDRGWITVDERMATNVPGIYAIGDVTGKLPLAHVATAMGEVAVEVIAGEEPEPLNYVNMPKPVYTHPQIASLGLTAAQAREQGYEVQVGTFPLQASGKALALGDHNGFAQIVADAQYGEVLGAHLIGPEATELLAEVGAVQLLEGTTNELGRLVHAHPTLSEVVKEAALATEGRAIHM